MVRIKELIHVGCVDQCLEYSKHTDEYWLLLCDLLIRLTALGKMFIKLDRKEDSEKITERKHQKSISQMSQQLIDRFCVLCLLWKSGSC